MGVYIPNFEMPKFCSRCPLYRLQETPRNWATGECHAYPYCFELDMELKGFPNIPTDCPLIEIDDEAIDIAQDIIDGCKRFKERRADEKDNM